MLNNVDLNTVSDKIIELALTNNTPKIYISGPVSMYKDDNYALRKFIDKTENYNITETKSVCYADVLALAIGQGVADFGLPKPKITVYTTSYTTPAEPVPVENPVEKVFG